MPELVYRKSEWQSNGFRFTSLAVYTGDGTGEKMTCWGSRPLCELMIVSAHLVCRSIDAQSDQTIPEEKGKNIFVIFTNIMVSPSFDNSIKWHILDGS